jgi:hypothetical protein
VTNIGHIFTFVKEERLLGLVDTRQRRQNLNSRFIHPDGVADNAESTKRTKITREAPLLSRENTIVAGSLMPLCGASTAMGIQTF